MASAANSTTPSQTPQTSPASEAAGLMGCVILLLLLGGAGFLAYDTFVSKKPQFDLSGPGDSEVNFAFGNACKWAVIKQYPSMADDSAFMKRNEDYCKADGIKILNRYKRKIDGETFHIVEFQIGTIRNTGYAQIISVGLVKRGDSWYSKPMN